MNRNKAGPGVPDVGYTEYQAVGPWDTMRVPGLCAVAWLTGLDDGKYCHWHDIHINGTPEGIRWVQYADSEECLLVGC